MNEPLVVASDWGWRHAGRARWAVKDVSFTLVPGERVLLLGASGSGKSTLLHALAGVLGGADEGEQAGTLSVAGSHPSRHRGVAGLVMQDPDGQVVMARVGDDVAFGPENLAVPREQIWPRVDAALDAVGLTVGRDHRCEELSGGQKQRLVLAGVLAMQPRLLLLDEPTANLDPAGVAEVRAAVVRTLERHPMTLVVVEHRVDVWLPVVDRVIVLDAEGGVLADGRPLAVFTQHREALLAAGVWVPGEPPPWQGLDDQPPAEPVLTTSDLAVGYPGRSPVRSGLDLAIERGRSTVVTGPNGSGKTTLAMTLAGLREPLAGRVIAAPSLVGASLGRRRRPLGNDPLRWPSRALLTRLGTVFQSPEHQFVAATVRAELEVGLRALGRPDDEVAARVDVLLDTLRLRALERAHPFTLSGGEKRRLSVAGVLATAPQVLVLDEPTFGQDRTTWSELVRLVRELRDGGQTIISVTHDADYIAALGERHLDLGVSP